jgi:hypothetical protein
MPRILRIDGAVIQGATSALVDAARATEIDLAIVDAVANCLNSVVGASKILHFVNPNVYPIWDAKVQRVWARSDPTQHYMSQTKNYTSYSYEVHRLRLDSDFHGFCTEFRSACSARLLHLAIPRYEISEVRVIESAAFELSGGEYEGG